MALGVPKFKDLRVALKVEQLKYQKKVQIHIPYSQNILIQRHGPPNRKCDQVLTIVGSNINKINTRMYSETSQYPMPKSVQITF